MFLCCTFSEILPFDYVLTATLLPNVRLCDVRLSHLNKDYLLTYLMTFFNSDTIFTNYFILQVIQSL